MLGRGRWTDDQEEQRLQHWREIDQLHRIPKLIASLSQS